jgi:Skp family chaperone for outer membrane proteins
MKFKIFLISLFFNLFFLNSYAEERVLFIDVEFILNSSEAGKMVNSQIKKEVDKNNKIFKDEETKLIDKEKKIIAQKNLLKEDEFQSKIKDFRKEYNEYIKKKKNILQKLDKANNEAKVKIFNTIRELLADYSTRNNISMIVDKKNIIIGKKDFDITQTILDNLNKKIKEVKLNF